MALPLLGMPTQAQTPTPAVVPAAAVTPATTNTVELTLEDQFGREQKLSAMRGRVVVLVYGDRKGTDLCRGYGEQLHVLFHPSAKGKPAAEARNAPVSPLPGVPMGQASPDVLIVPVACAANVPNVVQEFVKASIKKAAPETVVLMDFAGVMEKAFGLRAGEPNLVIFDTNGRVRLKVNGTPDAATGQKLVQTIQNLRAEAVAQ
ncbi:MAG: hypothetical protein LC104_13530 [Bacteroidales bacterium]|nr:hypothetical protein [Bacteroidales bacterium]